jgi:hypothetical protein
VGSDEVKRNKHINGKLINGKIYQDFPKIQGVISKGAQDERV